MKEELLELVKRSARTAREIEDNALKVAQERTRNPARLHAVIDTGAYAIALWKHSENHWFQAVSALVAWSKT